ncbi:DUF4397 domain-containing protein [Hymenobacter sp. BT683]|uniref:DUF4397 domain-containing protein n=1 Tax=Hymenobacter jeongseonensis TaxID=2791027 RepID=A0ABS0IJ98_9BACT|nr:DUF4397 domain-containing protein [Hymenobacter jeongseonensis]MBF9238449.1 DUF4397 domain-containing protein [Hymenobacter jeongseonensis]
MNTSFIFRRAFQALLPATLLLAACGKDDVATPIVDQGRINAYHMAASANVPVKILFDDVEKATLTYGQSSGYQTINAGSRTIKVNVASSGASAFAPQTVTVEKDRSYSYFAYANTATTVAGLLVPDDLTAPAAGKAKIRLVHLGLDSPSPLKLSTTAAAISDIPNTTTNFASASAFVEIQPGQYNVAVTSGALSVPVVNVGDGSGSGAGTNKTYEAGKIYTVVVRGNSSPLVSADLQTKAVLIQNN